MGTLGPTLNATGFFIPDYSDIFAQLQSQYLTIYGADSRLDPNTQDGQFLAIFANAINDCNAAAQATYNAFGLNTAQGAGLSSLVKLIGVRRQGDTFSTDTLEVVGTPNTTINNGQVGDDLNQGTIWNLPSSVVIPGGGTIEVEITCTTAGDIEFEPDQITTILTPTLGWASASNVGPAEPGAAVQDDAQLRAVATSSVGGPASTILSAIFAAIANVPNVTRFTVYENDTDVNDGNGQGPHSIYAVIQDGNTQDIVNAIGSTKSPGTTTLGTTSGTYIDPSGVPDVISYYELTGVPITVIVNLTPLNGFVSSTTVLIQNAVVQLLNNLAIGGDSYLSKLYNAANLSGDAAVAANPTYTQAQLDAISATYNVTSIEQARPSDLPPAVRDVIIAFNEAANSNTGLVTVNS